MSTQGTLPDKSPDQHDQSNLQQQQQQQQQHHHQQQQQQQHQQHQQQLQQQQLQQQQYQQSYNPNIPSLHIQQPPHQLYQMSQNPMVQNQYNQTQLLLQQTGYPNPTAGHVQPMYGAYNQGSQNVGYNYSVGYNARFPYNYGGSFSQFPNDGNHDLDGQPQQQLPQGGQPAKPSPSQQAQLQQQLQQLQNMPQGVPQGIPQAPAYGAGAVVGGENYSSVLQFLPQVNANNFKVGKISKKSNGTTSGDSTLVSGGGKVEKPKPNKTVAKPGGRSKAKGPAPDSTAERPFACEFPGCDWSFSRQSDLRRHAKSHVEPMFHCPYWRNDPTCHRNGGAFNRLDVLKRHLKLVHYVQDKLQLIQDSREDPGWCRSCQRMFPNSKYFIDHCLECAHQGTPVEWKQTDSFKYQVSKKPNQEQPQQQQQQPQPDSQKQPDIISLPQGNGQKVNDLLPQNTTEVLQTDDTITKRPKKR